VISSCHVSKHVEESHLKGIVGNFSQQLSISTNVETGNAFIFDGIRYNLWDVGRLSELSALFHQLGRYFNQVLRKCCDSGSNQSFQKLRRSRERSRKRNKARCIDEDAIISDEKECIGWNGRNNCSDQSTKVVYFPLSFLFTISMLYCIYRTLLEGFHRIKWKRQTSRKSTACSCRSSSKCKLFNVC